jgi:hypothetical protein
MKQEDLLATLKSVHQNLPETLWVARGGTVYCQDEPVVECLDLGMGRHGPGRQECVRRAELIAHLRNMLPIVIEDMEQGQ